VRIRFPASLGRPGLLALLLTVLAAGPLTAQDAPAEAPAEAPLVAVKINPRILEADHSVSWEQPLQKAVRPGTPIILTIDAAPLSIRITVTPFVRGQDFLLVVQGDVKQDEGTGVRRSKSLQSLRVPQGETIAYFPLGREPGENGRQLVVYLNVGYQGE